MVRRVTPAQLRSMIQKAQQDQRRAVDDYNRKVREFNRAVEQANRQQARAVADYNRAANAHNAKVRANRARLQSELRRLGTTRSTSTVTVRYTTSTRLVSAVENRYSDIGALVEDGRWGRRDDLLDAVEGETADAVAALAQMLDESADDDIARLSETTLTGELSDFSPDLEARWSGALYALSPKNPDAARHFCTSARELVTALLDGEAPDAAVKAANADYARTPNGGVSRRAKIQYCLARKGNDVQGLADFVDADIDAVIGLFDDFNHGTHGAAGRFPLGELLALKARVENAVRFLHRVMR